MTNNKLVTRLEHRARFLREALPQNEVGDCFINASSCEAIAALLDEAAGAFERAIAEGWWRGRRDTRIVALSVAAGPELQAACAQAVADISIAAAVREAVVPPPASGWQPQVARVAVHLRTRAVACERLAMIDPDGLAARNWQGLADELKDDAWALEELAAGRDVAALLPRPDSSSPSSAGGQA